MPRLHRPPELRFQAHLKDLDCLPAKGKIRPLPIDASHEASISEDPAPHKQRVGGNGFT